VTVIFAGTTLARDESGLQPPAASTKMPSVSEDAPAAASYRRTITASVARIWENVLDWEHLPWLHRTSFAAVRAIRESPEGWRAWVTTRGERPQESLIEVLVDRPRLRYVARTIDGDGAGSAIWTRVEPAGALGTRIDVDFHFAALDPAAAARLGAAYVRLYTRLWDEDEAMMTRRERLLEERRAEKDDGRGSLSLGPFEELRARLPLVVRSGGRDFRIVDVAGELHAHPTVCPHLGGPLDTAPVADGCVTCPWHGYRYDVRSGECASGQPFRLGRALRIVRDEQTAEATLRW
jgi:nitrite reductase/ring-hydroxylating ferredoxin subunit